MATKKPAKKTLNKKAMKKTKGGVLIGLLLPAVQKVRVQDGVLDLKAAAPTADGSV